MFIVSDILRDLGPIDESLARRRIEDDILGMRQELGRRQAPALGVRDRPLAVLLEGFQPHEVLYLVLQVTLLLPLDIFEEVFLGKPVAFERAHGHGPHDRPQGRQLDPLSVLKQLDETISFRLDIAVGGRVGQLDRLRLLLARPAAGIARLALGEAGILGRLAVADLVILVP
jgi:hypothetical protein